MSMDVLLMGCGEMGSALLSRWVSADWPGRITVVSRRERPGAEPRGERVLVVRDAADIPAGFAPRAVVLAVMTGSMEEALPPCRRYRELDAVYLSIAAGLPFAFFERHLGQGAAVVRAMPNTPAAVGRGISLAVANGFTRQDQKDLCRMLLECAGEVIWSDNERLLDPATALSGAGPAYIFHLVECLARAGQASGLPPDVAAKLARATAAGAGELLRRSPESTQNLIRNVARPGGVTERALAILGGPDGIGPIFETALKEATARARQLSRQG